MPSPPVLSCLHLSVIFVTLSVIIVTRQRLSREPAAAVEMPRPILAVYISVGDWVAAVDHFPVSYIDAYMGDRVRGGISTRKENQISRLHVLFGNRGTQVIQPLRRLPAHIPHAGMVDYP